ncbi:hypothetical protein ACEWY4_017228 [Coilia grayii]|uniref:AIG1-type G domain-containing protein n=1 Tax=Coilia grayii TaxID=363190 RepID=A0ABD1JHB0_9TELE
MLLGKNATAKRMLANGILGREAFSRRPEPAIIHRCRGKNGPSLGQRNVTVIESVELQNTLDMARRLNTCVSWASPRPHLFLYVAELGERVCDGIRLLNRSLGAVALNFTVVAFLRSGDNADVDDRCKEQTLVKELRTCFKGSYHFLSGGDDGLNRRPTQLRAVMDVIDTLMSEHMGYQYTQELQQQQPANHKNEIHQVVKHSDTPAQVKKDKEQYHKQKENTEKKRTSSLWPFG